MGIERHGGLRAQIAALAAELMLHEEVKQYFTAKRLAAKRLLGRGRAKSLRYRPHDLPSNGEIKDALLELVEETEGERRFERLFAMRITALEAMEALTPFTPRLIGSVATGHVRRGSDVDLHVFAPHPLDVVAHVAALGWSHDVQHVSIVKGGRPMDFTHVHVEDVFPLELTVHEPMALRHRPRSSTDGKPIVRLSPAAVRALCEREHPQQWARYVAHGEVPSWQELVEGDQRTFWTK
ncbi:MAG: nucleotide-binding enzyme [Sandaracinaceae bacterium]|nr:nucleotide-binding enzyme [Sandaracinaceae bacterium]